MPNPIQKDNPGLWDDSFRLEVESRGVDSGVLIWHFAGACFALRTPECLLYLDPFFGGDHVDCTAGVHMNCAIPLDPSRLKRADAALISHEHYDHCHRETLLPMAANIPGMRFYGPGSAVKEMLGSGIPAPRIAGVRAGDRLRIGDISVDVRPGYDPDSADAVSFLIDAAGVRLFFGGDTRIGPAFEEIGRGGGVDIAMLAFGRNYYMDEGQILQAAEILKAKLLLPYHWELSRGNTGDPIKLGRLIEHNKPPFTVKLLMLGDFLRYRSNSDYEMGL